MTDEEILALMERNLALAQETRDLAAKTYGYIKWMRVMDIIKILLIVLPIIATLIFLPALINSLAAGYGAIVPSELLK